MVYVSNNVKVADQCIAASTEKKRKKVRRWASLQEILIRNCQTQSEVSPGIRGTVLVTILH